MRTNNSEGIMELTFGNFIIQIIQNPILLVVTALILGVIFVNGWIDAPNAIATCVTTRSISPKSAIIMSAIFNFLGIFVMTFISSTVAETIFKIADFGTDPSSALVALCAAMVAIVVWAILAWIFGIPTSQSHSMIAGLSGAAIALQNGFSGINMDEWQKVIIGLGVSTVFGFIFGYLIVKIIEKICKKMDRRKTIPFFKKTQILAGATMSFMNGAQDGQKFIGVFLIGVALINGATNSR